MSDRPDVSVIIPMHNAGTTICGVVESFLDIVGPTVEVIVVDDGSTDRSVERVLALNREGLIIERMGANRGPGVARNRGFARAMGRYTLFFDADDEVHASTLVAGVEALDATGADVAVMEYRYRRGRAVGSEDMNSFDAAFWSRRATGSQGLCQLNEVPQLLGLSNYPWNKLARIDHYRKTGLRYGTTRVHEDILGHWLTLLDARSIVLIDRPLCTHIVNEGGRNESNREGVIRLNLLDALDETYTAIEARPVQRREFACQYWEFVLRVTDWARPRIIPNLREQFNVRLTGHLLRADLADFARLRMSESRLASRIVRHVLA